jgi:hypothetical protein
MKQSSQLMQAIMSFNCGAILIGIIALFLVSPKIYMGIWVLANVISLAIVAIRIRFGINATKEERV